MAMNKAERAAMEELRRQLDLARALRWPECPAPEAIVVKYDSTGPRGIRVLGWFVNAYSERIQSGWSTSSNHSVSGIRSTPMAGPHPLYKSRLDALLYLRYQLTEKFASSLAEIDKQIGKERIDPTPHPDKAKEPSE